MLIVSATFYGKIATTEIGSVLNSTTDVRFRTVSYGVYANRCVIPYGVVSRSASLTCHTIMRDSGVFDVK